MSEREPKKFNAGNKNEIVERPLSAGFMQLIAGEAMQKEMVEGSHVKITSDEKPVPYYEEWRMGRQFIADIIHKDGTILDIGSANGFLLRCLQEWSDKKLEPYGIEPDENLLTKSRKLFPGEEDHFVALKIHELNKLAAQGMPESYDVVFWNVWDNWDFKSEEQLKALDMVQDIVASGGRLILGFYDENSVAQKRISKLRQQGLSISGTSENKQGHGIVAWVNKD
jgi:hypothetical protein